METSWAAKSQSALTSYRIGPRFSRVELMQQRLPSSPFLIKSLINSTDITLLKKEDHLIDYDEHGYGPDGYNKDGYDKDGYDQHGFDMEGYNIDGEQGFG